MAVAISCTAETAVDMEGLALQAQQALDQLGLDAEVSILICDDAFIRPLNKDWRDKDAATDVLSFPQLEFSRPGVLPEGEGTQLLGDIVISEDTAGRQAGELGHGLQHECTVLMVHGLCHLLGYDHLDAADRKFMQAVEQDLLAELLPQAAGLGLVERSQHG